MAPGPGRSRRDRRDGGAHPRRGGAPAGGLVGPQTLVPAAGHDRRLPGHPDRSGRGGDRDRLRRTRRLGRAVPLGGRRLGGAPARPADQPRTGRYRVHRRHAPEGRRVRHQRDVPRRRAERPRCGHRLRHRDGAHDRRPVLLPEGRPDAVELHASVVPRRDPSEAGRVRRPDRPAARRVCPRHRGHRRDRCPLHRGAARDPRGAARSAPGGHRVRRSFRPDRRSHRRGSHRRPGGARDQWSRHRPGGDRHRRPRQSARRQSPPADRHGSRPEPPFPRGASGAGRRHDRRGLLRRRARRPPHRRRVVGHPDLDRHLPGRR